MFVRACGDAHAAPWAGWQPLCHCGGLCARSGSLCCAQNKPTVWALGRMGQERAEGRHLVVECVCH